MSIGNLQDYGSKGTNFPWQLKMLQGIQGIITALTSPPSSILRSPNILSDTGAGSVPILNYGFSIANVGAANGTVKTVTLKPGETISFDGGALNNTLDAIAYVATSTEFLIITIV